MSTQLNKFLEEWQYKRRGNLLIPKLIQTEAENQAALARLDEIFDAKPGTPDGEKFELL